MYMLLTSWPGGRDQNRFCGEPFKTDVVEAPGQLSSLTCPGSSIELCIASSRFASCVGGRALCWAY